MSRRVFPSFCPGWAYVTTPEMGIRIAEMASNMPVHVQKMKRLDDIYMTGMVVERIPDSNVEQIYGGRTGYWWDAHLSFCPFLGITKATFFNDIVLRKGGYTGDVAGGTWFMFCAFWEYFILDNVEFLLPDVLPDCLTRLCAR